jgi:hypothetical protein
LTFKTVANKSWITFDQNDTSDRIFSLTYRTGDR